MKFCVETKFRYVFLELSGVEMVEKSLNFHIDGYDLVWCGVARLMDSFSMMRLDV